MGWKNLPLYAKGAIIGFLITILLATIFYSSSFIFSCDENSLLNEKGEILDGKICLNKIQEIILIVLRIVNLPFILLGATPSLSAEGPEKVRLFWIGSIICSTLLGLLIGTIIQKIKSRKIKKEK